VGFFKKIFKGIKKVIKKVGKAIKGVFKKVGKFMGKIGIIGQIGLALVLPGIGQMLSAGLVGATGTGGLAGALSGFGAVGKAAAGFIKGAVNLASRTSNFFSSITDGVGKILGETIGAVANKIPGLGETLKTITGGKLDITSKTFGSAWDATQTAFTDAVAAGKNIFVPTADPSAVSAMIESTTTPVQEGLQAQIDPTIGQPPVSTAAFDTAAEQLRQETLETTFSSESLLGQAPTPVQPTAAPITTGVPDYVAPETFTEKMVETGKEVFDVGVARAKEAATDIPRQVVQAGATKAMQAVGLADVPEYSYSQYSVNVPAIDMGSTTDIGYGLTTPSLQTYYDTYGANYIASNPYGQAAQLYDVYGEAMKARGFG